MRAGAHSLADNDLLAHPRKHLQKSLCASYI
jgi:hypothetical protein